MDQQHFRSRRTGQAALILFRRGWGSFGIFVAELKDRLQQGAMRGWSSSLAVVGG
jgi:hypothetical protein